MNVCFAFAFFVAFFFGCLQAVKIPDKEKQTPIKTRPCTGVEPTATLVATRISGCVEEPCVFPRGGNVTITVDFKLHRPAEKLEAFLYASIFGREVALSELEKEACGKIFSGEGGEARCPLSGGEAFTYNVTIPVSRNYPSLKTDVKFLLKDESEGSLICWIVRAHFE